MHCVVGPSVQGVCISLRDVLQLVHLEGAGLGDRLSLCERLLQLRFDLLHGKASQLVHRELSLVCARHEQGGKVASLVNTPSQATSLCGKTKRGAWKHKQTTWRELSKCECECVCVYVCVARAYFERAACERTHLHNHVRLHVLVGDVPENERETRVQHPNGVVVVDPELPARFHTGKRMRHRPITTASSNTCVA